ncbi:unnamed protein product [Amoebophrya sp. A120]|nr:unnamed protein product [Amoebophrya sp. A120]|eukprot:GSA120T00006159001.1
MGQYNKATSLFWKMIFLWSFLVFRVARCFQAVGPVAADGPSTISGSGSRPLSPTSTSVPLGDDSEGGGSPASAAASSTGSCAPTCAICLLPLDRRKRFLESECRGCSMTMAMARASASEVQMARGMISSSSAVTRSDTGAPVSFLAGFVSEDRWEQQQQQSVSRHEVPRHQRDRAFPLQTRQWLHAFLDTVAPLDRSRRANALPTDTAEDIDNFPGGAPGTTGSRSSSDRTTITASGASSSSGANGASAATSSSPEAGTGPASEIRDGVVPETNDNPVPEDRSRPNGAADGNTNGQGEEAAVIGVDNIEDEENDRMIIRGVACGARNNGPPSAKGLATASSSSSSTQRAAIQPDPPNLHCKTHAFHTDCIWRWIRQELNSGFPPRCPVCRSSIPRGTCIHVRDLFWDLAKKGELPRECLSDEEKRVLNQSEARARNSYRCYNIDVRFRTGFLETLDRAMRTRVAAAQRGQQRAGNGGSGGVGLHVGNNQNSPAAVARRERLAERGQATAEYVPLTTSTDPREQPSRTAHEQAVRDRIAREQQADDEFYACLWVVFCGLCEPIWNGSWCPGPPGSSGNYDAVGNDSAAAATPGQLEPQIERSQVTGAEITAGAPSGTNRPGGRGSARVSSSGATRSNATGARALLGGGNNNNSDGEQVEVDQDHDEDDPNSRTAIVRRGCSRCCEKLARCATFMSERVELAGAVCGKVGEFFGMLLLVFAMNPCCWCFAILGAIIYVGQEQSREHARMLQDREHCLNVIWPNYTVFPVALNSDDSDYLFGGCSDIPASDCPPVKYFVNKDSFLLREIKQAAGVASTSRPDNANHALVAEDVVVARDHEHDDLAAAHEAAERRHPQREHEQKDGVVVIDDDDYDSTNARRRRFYHYVSNEQAMRNLLQHMQHDTNWSDQRILDFLQKVSAQELLLYCFGKPTESAFEELLTRGALKQRRLRNRGRTRVRNSYTDSDVARVHDKIEDIIIDEEATRQLQERTDYNTGVPVASLLRRRPTAGTRSAGA